MVNDRDKVLEAEFVGRFRERNKQFLVDRRFQFNAEGTPSAEDLADSLSFDSGDGNIWLAGQRIMFMQAEVFGSIRRELIEKLGYQQARQLFMRMGWQAGARDAARVCELWPKGDGASLFSAGPRLHKLKGMVDVEVVQIEIDNARGRFQGEFLWHNSLEASEHLARYGVSSEAACWMQIGYASGYASALLGRSVVYREVECKACGHEHCRIVGKAAELWEDGGQDLFNAVDSVHARDAQDEHEDDSLMVGGSPAYLAATRLLSKVAPTEATVLLTGESGVGKELFAKSLHQQSRRKGGPLVSLNCATLPENLVEAELFGVEKGAFTGADKLRAGRFERAHGGTLFLDEIATLSLAAQGKILRVLQEGELERLGGSKTVKVDVRIVAATNLDLRDEVEAGRFREDLFYRLNVFPINLPPLRERREDLPLLMSYFLDHYCKRYNRHLTGFTTRLVNTLLAYRFPGNIRELQNLIERGVIIAEDGDTLDFTHLSLGENERLSRRESDGKEANTPPLQATEPEASEHAVESDDPLMRLRDFVSGRNAVLDTSLGEVEGLLITAAMERCDGNITAAAQMLGMTRAQLSYRLRDRK
ncbi:sigma-54-dependent Fis family transcriptional regulator [Marinobacterium marinum]|uniref:Sigma 54-interacting transcriptional regulator n=1 Tax=Marinobacterium marinum TaxID=2756129 RepID=A0A7W1WWN8_9GAMM|nr:sigma-54-dependent Fis family transcriptional regulator [Marinobacterium marinum]MBA4501589.1 sigma 54-interacting transcriptional regulator [Marinobacterium marinum]